MLQGCEVDGVHVRPLRCEPVPNVDGAGQPQTSLCVLSAQMRPLRRACVASGFLTRSCRCAAAAGGGKNRVLIEVVDGRNREVRPLELPPASHPARLDAPGGASSLLALARRPGRTRTRVCPLLCQRR